MTSRLSLYAQTFLTLIKEDWLIFRKHLLNKIIDSAIVVAITLIIWQFIMPNMGIPTTYGIFMLGSCLASAGLFESYGQIASMVSDFAGDRKISYYLTLPIPTWMVFLKITCSLAIKAAVIAATTFIVGSIVLWNHFNIVSVSFVKLIPFWMVASLFFGAFALWVTSMVPNMHRFSSVWTRFIFPLWIFGGFQFSWATVAALSAWASYALLIDPLIYVSEGYRNVLLGSAGSLPYFLCMGMLLFFYLIFLYMGIKRLQQRLDFV